MAAAIISLPTIILTSLILRETNFKFYSLATPSTLSFFIGLLMGVIYTHLTKKAWAYIFVGLLLSANLWIALMGYDMWIHRLNYGTFTGKQEVEINNAVFHYANGKSFILEQNAKPFMLEFWSTSCGVCIEQLPLIQEFFNSQSSEIDIYLVCVVYEQHDYQLAQEILKRNNITVPLLFYQDVDGDLARKFKVTAFPTTVGIDRNVIFHVGNIFSMKKRFTKK